MFRPGANRGAPLGNLFMMPPAETESPHDLAIDITGDLCPMTFVRTRLALDRLATGQVLLVRLKGEEPRRNVPRTATEQGHAVLAQHEETGDVLRLLIRKGG